MGVKLLESYVLGDMKALYFLDEEKRLAELMLCRMGWNLWDGRRNTRRLTL